MDIDKIGNYIALCRKEKGLTQAYLAENLHITDKAVSKWERGLSLPDISLLEPLSNLLDISVTELLNGESLHGKDIPKEIADHLITGSNTLYTANEIKKSKYKTILFALILLLIVFLSLFGFHYIKTQNDLSAISNEYHSACDNIGLLYDELTDERRNALFHLSSQEYANALFFIGGADAVLYEAKASMQDYRQLYDYAEQLQLTIGRIYDVLQATPNIDGDYIINSSSDYEILILEMYEEYHGFIDSYGVLRKNASFSGTKAF